VFCVFSAQRLDRSIWILIGKIRLNRSVLGSFRELTIKSPYISECETGFPTIHLDM